MAEIVNLGRMKKQQRRAAAAQAAAENRVRHGRTKAEKLADAREAARRAALLDNVRCAPETKSVSSPIKLPVKT